MDLGHSESDSDTVVVAPLRPGDGDAVPERLGRYVVLEVLGRGGMGAVYRAFDPELDRSVALKVIQSTGGAAFRERLRREARALAKLSHPNVLPVFDVGTWNHELFLATEYVRGEDLRAWLGEPRSWVEVLAVFLQAGRGLAAAHREGIVHRDFKPANVMLGRDGRVRVVDFGLAQLAGVAAHGVSSDGEGDRTSDGEGSAGGSLTAGGLTQVGVVMGSPPYMAPELHRGAAAGVSSDQYAFCVSLWQALTGQRPFVGADLDALYLAKQSPPSPTGDRAPRWLLEVVARGMAFEPEARWPSIDALIAALEHDPARRRRRVLGVCAGLVATLGLGGVGASYVHAQSQQCAGASVAIEPRWNDERRHAVHDAIAATGLSYAATTSERVVHGLDTYLDEWSRARTDACEATRSRGEQSDEDLFLRMRCYDRHLEEAAALIDVLSDADADAVRRAVSAVGGLPRAIECADIESLRADLPPTDPEVATQVDALQLQLAQAKALESAGRYDAALAMVATLLVSAEELGYGPLLARLRFRRGWIKVQAGREVEAEPEIVDSYRLALELGMLDLAAAASAALVWTVASQPGRRAEGKTWALHAGALAEATDRDDARAWVANNLGLIARYEGDFDESFVQLERAIELKSRLYGPESHEVALSLMNLGGTHLELGDLDAAREAMTRAVDLYQAELGAEHPSVAVPIANLGIIEERAGRLEESIRHQQHAIAIFEATLGPDSPRVGTALANLGTTLQQLGRRDEARAAYTRALTLLLPQGESKRPGPVDMRVLLAQMALEDEAYDEAVALAELAVAAFTEDHPVGLRAEGTWILARALWGAPRGDRPRARALAEDAQTIAVGGGDETSELAERIDGWRAGHR